MGQSAIARQLDAWQVLPQTERVSELYFTQHRKLPLSAPSGATRTLDFTVHNLEHKQTAYHYTVALLADGVAEQVVADDTFVLGHNESKTVSPSVSLPPLGPRIAVVIRLNYEGIRPGQRTPSLQTQSIHHWIRLEAAKGAR